MYIGKTERNLVTRLIEHINGQDSAISDHLKSCSNYLEELSQFSILYEVNDVSFDKRRLNAIYSNTTVIDRHNHWLTLCFFRILSY